MTDFKHTLEQFRQGSLDFEQLVRAARGLAEQGLEARRELLALLYAEQARGRLPLQVCRDLEARLGEGFVLDHPTVLNSQSGDDPTMVMLSQARSALPADPPDNDPTMVMLSRGRPAMPVGQPDNDPTMVMLSRGKPVVSAGPPDNDPTMVMLSRAKPAMPSSQADSDPTVVMSSGMKLAGSASMPAEPARRHPTTLVVFQPEPVAATEDEPTTVVLFPEEPAAPVGHASADPTLVVLPPSEPTVFVGEASGDPTLIVRPLADQADDEPTTVVLAAALVPGEGLDADAPTVLAGADVTAVLSVSPGDVPTVALAAADVTTVLNPPPSAGEDITALDQPPIRPGLAADQGDVTALVGDPPVRPSSAADLGDSTAVLDRAPASPAHAPPSPQAVLNPAESARSATQATYGTHAATRAQPYPAPNADGPLRIGMILKERFVLEEVIGGGGMGTVFKALDMRKSEARDREPFVALKVLNPEFRDNPIALIALQRETKRAQTLSHPNIINVFDFDRDGNHVFMSMEYLTGRPLNQVIRETPEGMPFKKAWPIIRDMAEALGYAHQKDVVHSDFKPGNVFFDDAGEVRILDFGIACAAGRAEKAGADATIFNARDLGALTPAYASLEMIQKKDPDPRDDLYALGCVAYELLTGKHPYGKLSADKALELKLQPKPVPGLNRRQWRGLQRAVALKREDRVPTAEAFVKDLQRRTPAFYALWGLVLVAVATSGASVYFGMFAPQEAAKPVAVQLSEEQQRQVKDLLEVAAIHYEVGYLTAPTGNNALWAYREALKIDPYNAEAIQGLTKIADALEQSAWKAFEQGNQPESLKLVVEGLDAVPDHPGLKSLRSKLER
jgi:serine/threonine protein kinase